MVDWKKCPHIERIPGKVSGKWVLKDSRFMISTIFANLASGASIEHIARWYGGITEEQLDAVLQFVVDELDADLIPIGPDGRYGEPTGPAPGDGVLDWSKCPTVGRLAGRVSGKWTLKGTRFMISTIFANLSSPATISDVVDWYDGVTEEQCSAILDFVADQLEGDRIILGQAAPSA